MASVDSRSLHSTCERSFAAHAKHVGRTGGTVRRNTGLLVLAALVLVTAGVFAFLYPLRGRPAALPAQSPAQVTALPGDPYIDSTARAYVQTVIGGNPDAIQRLCLSTIDPRSLRTETLGRFASVRARFLKAVAVHDEQAVSGNGDNNPATSWKAVVVVQVLKSSHVETFGVQVAGTYGTNGSVDSSHADPSVR